MWPFTKSDRGANPGPTFFLHRKVEPVETKKQWNIDIYLKSGAVIGWTNSQDTKNHPWRGFYHWYFGRPQSQYFRFVDKVGETMILRSEITRFRVEKRTVKTTGEVPPG